MHLRLPSSSTSPIDCTYDSYSCNPSQFYFHLALVITLVAIAGLMAGLTMGLLSLDKLNMTILKMEGSEKQRIQATTILSVINHRHWLLVTLLLCNAAANEALPVVLGKMVPEATAIVLSVTCVLFFGEIIPSAVFTGESQVSISATLAPYVQILMYLTAPLAWPLSKILDYVLGADHDMTKYNRNELKALIGLQRATRHSSSTRHGGSKAISTRQSSTTTMSDYATCITTSPSECYNEAYNGGHGKPLLTPSEFTLGIDEVTIIHGALDLTRKKAHEIMIPFDEVFMLEETCKLDDNLMADIIHSGHSRIPIFRETRQNVIGVLLVKKLIVLDPEDERPITDLHLRTPIVVHPNFSCYALLNEFQKGKSHIAFLSRQAKDILEHWDTKKQENSLISDYLFEGIVTLEDVLEELIQEEIEDESDEKEDPHLRKSRLRDAGLKRAVRVFRGLLHKIRNRKLNQAHRKIVIKL